MSGKRSHHSRAEEPPGADDLTVITGIGPAVESRLHRVGVFTFAQLAALSPADIAASVSDLTGLTAERIIKQDWIGQARKLAAKSTLVEPEWTEQVRSLVTSSTSTKSEKDAEAPVKPSVAEKTRPSLPATAMDSSVGVLLLTDIKTESPRAGGPRRLLQFNQPFSVQLTLDLTKVKESSEAPLNYTAIIYGKQSNGDIRHTLGEGHGTITPIDRVNIDVECTASLRGAYRLIAIVTLASATTESATLPKLTALKKGSLLYSY